MCEGREEQKQVARALFRTKVFVLKVALTYWCTSEAFRVFGFGPLDGVQDKVFLLVGCACASLTYPKVSLPYWMR